MNDREMVIRHFQEAIEASVKNNKWRFVRLDIIEKAISLLKEQKPLKPFRGNSGWQCSACGNLFYYRQQYCDICGRAVKWDE